MGMMGPMRADGPIRILIADRSADVCHALSHLLDREVDFEVAGVAQTEDETLEAAAVEVPDIVLLDSQLPRRSVGAFVQALSDAAPAARPLLLVVHPADGDDVEADVPWTLKDSGRVELAARVREVVRGAA